MDQIKKMDHSDKMDEIVKIWTKLSKIYQFAKMWIKLKMDQFEKWIKLKNGANRIFEP